VTRLLHSPNVAYAVLCVLGLGVASPAAAQPARPPKPAAKPANELDAFMEKVLKRREINRQVLQQYVLDELEEFEVLGPSRMPLYRHRRDFTWYVRDGLHVRSPVRFDGVTVGEEARKQYEDSWTKRERGRLAAKDADKGKDKPSEPPPPPPDDPAGPTDGSPIPTPRFVSEAYFMDFKFEPGNYYLAGREQIEGQTVLKIEYYPTRLFNDDDERERERNEARQKQDKNDRHQKTEERIERQMNKTALITLWVDPAEHQIVKYTFDNVWMDFLPAAWLIRVDDIHASMSMGQPFPGVWLPREINIRAGVTLAMGSLDAAYGRRFSDYKQAEVATKIRIPKEPEAPRDECCSDEAAFDALENPDPPLSDGGAATPYTSPSCSDCGDVPAGQSVPEVIAEIRVHGNAYLRDDEVIRLSGISLGQQLGPDGVAEIERKLKASGFFETVEVRKRYRSLESATDVAVVLLVHERAGQRSEIATEPPSRWPWSRVKGRLMFLPILGYDDGYGFTYGGRISTIGLFGVGERVSVPLTWGGTRRAAVEVDRTFDSGPLTRVESTFGISQRENPRFEIHDQRIEWTALAERSFAGLVRTAIKTSQSTVEFGTYDDRLWTLGADAALDTRGDPNFPRNAVYLGVGWSGLHVRRLDEPINRFTTDARGYVGLIRQSVLAARARYSTADRTLPPYERYLLGGAQTLRGFGAGSFEGDRMFVTSAELRIPITSVLSGAKLGATAFFDAGKAFDVGQRISDATWHRGAGGGLFLIATVVRINLDIAHGLKTGDTRVHLSSGFSF
jgi:Omp85 superfamily domain